MQTDVVSFSAFILILLDVSLAAPFALWRGGAKTPALRLLIFIFVWLGLLLLPVSTGFIEAQPVPRLFLFLGACNVVGLALALSRYGKLLAQVTSLSALVLFQAFRLPLELVLHAWVKEGFIPPSMTWTGSNWDIVSGLTCLFLGPFANKYRAAAWLANVTGFVFLLNVMRVAVMSSPVPFGWGVTPPLTLAYQVPYYLIVPVCVAGALAGHVILTRKLIGK